VCSTLRGCVSSSEDGQRAAGEMRDWLGALVTRGVSRSRNKDHNVLYTKCLYYFW